MVYFSRSLQRSAGPREGLPMKNIWGLLVQGFCELHSFLVTHPTMLKQWRDKNERKTSYLHPCLAVFQDKLGKLIAECQTFMGFTAVLLEMDILLTILGGAQVDVLEPPGLITSLLTLACLWPIHFLWHKSFAVEGSHYGHKGYAYLTDWLIAEMRKWLFCQRELKRHANL